MILSQLATKVQVRNMCFTMPYKKCYNKFMNFQNSKITFKKRIKIPKNILLIIICIVAGSLIGLMLSYFQELPSVEDLQKNKPSLSTKIYDCNGNLIDQLYIQQRTLVPLSEVPPVMQQIITEVEDSEFYKHWGIDIPGITRAFFVNLIHGRIIQGGSTITQQLAKNLFLTKEKSLTRKIKEIILSLQIESKYTKKEILEMYLNQIYFGSGAYGIEAASRIYFGKHASELTFNECALLAALPRSPNRYSPYYNLQKAVERRNAILTRLETKKIISKKETEKAKKSELKLVKTEIKNAPYFVELVRQTLENTYGSNVLYRGGLSVYTTLDLRIQEAAERALKAGVADAEQRAAEYKGVSPEKFRKSSKPLQCSMLVIDSKTGYVRALIGGREFKESEYNRAIQSRRQPGSSFKPFIYTAAIDNGFTAADILLDEPVVFTDRDGKKWKPENYDRKFTGFTTLRDAITHSKNVPTVKLLSKVGIDNAIEYASRMGITGTLRRDLTIALGTSEVSMIELVSAFSIFPNLGTKADPVFILNVKDIEGKILEEHPVHTEEILKPETAFVMTSLLQSVVDHGTAYGIRSSGVTFPAGGKTGTTDNNTDVWFIGFTSNLTGGVWLGYDDKKPMGAWASSAAVAVPIWAHFIKDLSKEFTFENFTEPPNIIYVDIDPGSGLLATKNCKNTKKELFIKGTEPVKPCNMHKSSAPTW